MGQQQNGARKSTKWVVPAGIVAAIVVVVGVMLAGSYNGLNAMRNKVDSQWAQVENVMNRQSQLIPNINATVKGQMEHETDIMEQVSKGRAGYAQAEADPSASRNEKLAAGDEMNKSLSLYVNAIKESYPNLGSDQSIQSMVTELEGSINRISQERRTYIQTVNEYNTKVTSFPANITAGMMGFQRMKQYTAPAGTLETPKVEF